MSFLLICVIICIVINCSLSWLLPRFLAWLCKRKYKLSVEIGRIGVGFWYLTLRDVKLSKNHISVQIDEVGLRSRVFSSEVAKLLSVVIKDLRIDVNAIRSDTAPNSVFGRDREISFHNQKIPPVVITFVQFMAIHVYNVNVMFLRAESPEWLVHVSAGEAHLDGSIIHNARTLLVNMSVTSTSAKLLKHAGQMDPQTCLGELSFGITSEATVIAQGPLSVEKLYLGYDWWFGTDDSDICGRKLPIIYTVSVVPLLHKDWRSLRSLCNQGKVIKDDPLRKIYTFLKNPCRQHNEFIVSVRSPVFVRRPAPKDKKISRRNIETRAPASLAVWRCFSLRKHSPICGTNFSGVTNMQAIIHEAIYGFAQRTRLDAPLPATEEVSTDLAVLFHNWLPIIPKNFNLNVENSMLNGMRDENKVDFSGNLRSLLINTQVDQSSHYVENKLPQLFLSFKLENFDIKCNKVNIIDLSRLTVDGNYEDDALNVDVRLDKLILCYEHAFMKPWVVNNFLRTKQTDLVASKKRGMLIRSRSSWFENFTNSCQISGRMELFKVCVWCHLPEEPMVTSFGFHHMQFNLDKLSDLRTNVYDSPIGKLLFGKRHWSFELLLESCWCRIGHSLLNKDSHMLKKYHTWGTPLYIGVVLVKVRSQGAQEVKIHAMIDLFRTEWSPQLALYVVQCKTCAEEYTLGLIKTENRPKLSTSNVVYTTALACTNANLYWLAEKDICVMMRIDKLNVDDHKGKIDWLVEGFKISAIKPTAIQHSCVRSEEIKSMCVHVKSARLNFVSSTRDLSVKVQEQVQVKWSPNLHLKALKLYEDICDFKTVLLPYKVKENVAEKTKLNWAVKIDGDSQVLLSLSKKHEIVIVASELAFGRTQNYAGVETILLKIAVDDADIFTFTKVQICRRDDDPEVADERRKAEGFSLIANRVWCTTIDSFKVCFPYEHNWAEAVQGEMVSTWKWLKVIHKKGSQPFSSQEPLPADLHIRFNEFLFEMSDDPFEVRLRDNYVLLEDEYKESVKRKNMLDAKVEALCQTHLLSMPPGKIEELYAGLRKKNAEIYIQRSKLMKKSPQRTRLFAWCMSDVELIALADPTIHGKQTVCNIMDEIDPDSPWPEEGLDFSTLWCRSVFGSFKEWEFQLRDFPQPLMLIKSMQIFGRLVGAEQMATKRARRSVQVELGEPWGSATVERSMTTLKFYHDLNCEVEHLRYAFGPCWEPVIAQCNLSFEKISPPSRDPSPVMPWWDKMRLLFHGRLTMFTRQLTMLLHASLDPYNTTEEMELTWSTVAMDWTNGKFVFQGDFNVFVRTASKYDDCRLLQLPHLKLTLKLSWVCLSDPNDHHAVMPCAPDKLPEYSSNQEHDSFRAFRSQNLNVTISLETKAVSPEFEFPSALLYGSTLRWFENLKLILSGVTRPTRKGAIFNNLRAKKKQLSRHYRKVRILIGMHRFQVYYWMSFAMQRGFELLGGRITFNSEHILNLTPIDDGLLHRPRAEWSVSYMNCDLNDAEIWLKSALQGTEVESELLRQPVEKCYCLSVVKVSYGRETVLHRRPQPSSTDTPTHKLVVYDLKGAWTKSNRDVAFALFDTFMKSKQLKKNLSTEALKGFRGENSKSRSSKSGSTDSHLPKSQDGILTPTTPVVLSVTSTPSPLTGAGTSTSMLQQLIAEVDSKPVVFSDDLSVQTTGQRLQGLQACQEDDVTYKNWLISLINSQVLLKGCETKGYVILSAAKAEILQRIHNPVWKDRTLVSKTTWVGSLECMQYYATVAAGENATVDENIMWLTVDNIQEKEAVTEPPDVLHLVGSGQSVGGVVTETVGATSIDEGKDSPIQLQRIVSRCKCEFFYACYGETSIDPSTLEEVPALPMEDVGPWEKKERAVDAFTLMHHDLDVCTNSLQYAMILDIVNHLLLYVEPQRKELYERLQRMRFQLALHSTEDQRRPIQELQSEVRSMVSKLRRLEKESYLVHKALSETPEDVLLKEEVKNLNAEVEECKEMLASQSEELDLMLSCYKESQLSANQKLATMKGDQSVSTVRANEIVFKHAKWRLTEADGQLGISDLTLSNFLYTKNSKSDDSVEHLLELGYIHMINLLPNQIYSEVLMPTEIGSKMPVERKTSVRVFCREKAPVGGISVKEHLEINVVPMTVGITKKFYMTMMNFCFPGREADTIDTGDEVETTGKKGKSTGKRKDTNFYVKIEQKDDVEKMKDRAEKNKIFIYIKIPEVPVIVSYKGSKEKNLEDMRDFRITIPTLEYHNVTWTWLDLLLALKTASRRVILPQVMKQKLAIKGRKGGAEEEPKPQEEDKARILFGARAIQAAGPSVKEPKKGLLKFTR